jgi:hypothetical protein
MEKNMTLLEVKALIFLLEKSNPSSRPILHSATQFWSSRMIEQ